VTTETTVNSCYTFLEFFAVRRENLEPSRIALDEMAERAENVVQAE
jgi:hypothetical protein